MTIRLGSTIPALPVRDIAAAVEHYRERFGFEAPHAEDGFALLRRDDAEIHLWAAADEDWRRRPGLAEKPVCSGAESFIAGTASCRIETQDVDGLHAELRDAQVLHAASRECVSTTDFGTREFHAVDLDGNLLTFFQAT
jgi:catechol 2,3-dioxygenase-like lactoylglutathione lyase family enzyme